jgi:hypothetical protein
MTRRFVSRTIRIATVAGGKTVRHAVVAYCCRGIGYRHVPGGYAILHVSSGHEVLRIEETAEAAQVAGWLLDEGERRGIKWTWAQSTLWKRGAKELVADAVRRYGK